MKFLAAYLLAVFCCAPLLAGPAAARSGDGRPLKQKEPAPMAPLNRDELAKLNEACTGQICTKAGAAGICATIADMANAGQLGKHVVTEAKNINFRNRKIDLMFTSAGTAQAPAVSGYDSESREPLQESEMPSLPRGTERLWGGDNLGLLVYDGHAHILYYKDFQHPVASASINSDSHCGFSVKVKEKMGPKAIEPGLCKQLMEDDEPTFYEFDGNAWVTQEDVSKHYSETGVAGTHMLDFANDGKPGNVAELELASGAGAGCDETFFDLLDKTGASFEPGVKRELLMKLQNGDPAGRHPILHCGNDPGFFEYKGKVYFQNKPKIWPPMDSWDEYHIVAKVDKGKVVDVCDFQFETTVSPRTDSH